MSSFRISIDPLDMKYNDVITSPLCTKVSPGGACVVLNFNVKALQETKKNKTKKQFFIKKHLMSP